MKSTMNTILSLLVLTLVAAPTLPGQTLWKKARRKISPIEDIIARTTGDILTIIVRESHKTKAQDKTDRKLDNSLTWKINAMTMDKGILGKFLSGAYHSDGTRPEFNSAGGKTFKGENKQERDQTVEARIAVMVVDVLPNGNLVVAGKRQIMVDDETRVLRISGIVRVRDIKSANTVSSDQVADARVAIETIGAGREHLTRGPIASCIHSLIWYVWPF